ncbi:AI-2E family transporter [Rhodoferax aquaticus]|uniref:AI-2E family transporter n=1 Tax=Rhodoferax aquaticus TaxID=2527691 RepID=A0A515EW41_9BURK|nr:AI-2E family transporter [Rhodoferax aquaticus]
MVLIYGLIPGLLAVCLGYLLANAIARVGIRRVRLGPTGATVVVIAVPLLGLMALLLNARGMVFGAVVQYEAMLHHLAGTVLEIRQKLPGNLAIHLPDELLGAQIWLSEYLKSQAHAIADLGTSGLRGGLLVYVGLVIGALIEGAPAKRSDAGELRVEMRKRASHFIDAFRQIVVAQFWIAAFNAMCTGVFLYFLLPLFGADMPYAGALTAFTFFAGLLPIVGNLICNGVLTLAGLSISPEIGLLCLVFLVFIHKFEYVINAKVVGSRTNTAAWELLLVMFLGEAVFALPGLISAPLFYAYLKKELQISGLI